MNKPDEIHQDAWDKGVSEAQFYADWLYAGNSTGSLSRHAIGALADTVARSIMAERERCAKIAEDDDGEHTVFGEDRNTRTAQRAARSIAAAIRSQP